jgi:hypothetical protein
MRQLGRIVRMKDQMQITTDRRKMPGEALPVLDEIERHGFETPDYIVTGGKLPDTTRRVQVRDTRELASSEVTRYAQAYGRGDKLPPVVVTWDWYLVDGATRTGGARKAGLAEIPQFRLKEKYEGASEATIAAFKNFGHAMNNMHGKGMSKANQANLILEGIAGGATHKELASRLHIGDSVIQGVLAEAAGRARAAELNLDLSALKPSHFKSLGGKERFTDPVWTGLAMLAQKAGMPVDEMNQVAKRIEGVRSEEGRLALLKEEMASNTDRIKGFTRKPSKVVNLKRAAGGFLSIEEDPASAIERDPEAVKPYLETLRRVRKIVEAVELANEEFHSGTAPKAVKPAPFRFGR